MELKMEIGKLLFLAFYRTYILVINKEREKNGKNVKVNSIF